MHEPNLVAIPSETSTQRRLWKRIALAGLVVVVLAASWYAYLAYRSEQRLALVLAETDRLDPGWRMEELEARRPVYPDDDNGIVRIRAAHQLLPAAPWPNWQSYVTATTQDQVQEQVQLLETGFNDLEPPCQLNATQIAALRAVLQHAGPALLEARKVADLPHGRYVIPWSRDFISTLLPHLQETREITELLAFDVLLRAQDQDLEGAWNSCRGILNGSRAIGDEPTAISQLVRIACRDRCVRRLERILAQGQISEASLATFQSLLEAEADQPLFLIEARGERAGLDGLLLALQNGDITLQQIHMALAGRRAVLGSMSTLGDLAFLIGFGSRKASRAAILERMNEVVEIAKLPTEQQLPLLKAWKEKITQQPILVRSIIPALDKIAEACHRSIAEMRCALAMVAAERYRLAHHDRWPRSLAELVPEYLPRVPADPYDGKPLRFHPVADGIVIYSIGLDGQDDGGKLSNNPVIAGFDWGVRLYDVLHRRQPAKPMPTARSLAEQQQPAELENPAAQEPKK